MFCVRCNDYGAPKMKKRGSDKLAVFAWLCFPFGLPYTIWRMASKYPVCPYCENRALVDADSPAGKRLMSIKIGEKQESNVSEVAPPKPVPTPEPTPQPTSKPKPPVTDPSQF